MPTNENEEFEFRLRAEKEAKAKIQPEIKSNADLIPGGGVSGSRNLGKEKEESLGEKLYGAGEAGLSALGSAATGIAAPFVGAGASMLGYQGKKGIQAQNAALDELNEQVYQPRTAPGQRYVSNIGNAIQNSGIGGLAGMNEMQALGHMAPPAIKQAGEIAKPITAPISEAVRAVPEIGNKI